MTKLRNGGLKAFEQRVLNGDMGAVRALVRQAGPISLDLKFRDQSLTEVPNGTGGTRLQFTGYASVTESPYDMADWWGDSYTEIVRSGAFTQTLNGNPDVIFCVNHDWSAVPMARTKAGSVTLSEDSTGLLVNASLDGSRSDVNILRSALEGQELDAMSFAFWVVRQEWSPDYSQRDILEIDMDGGDVSVVCFPANPATTGTTALRSEQAASLIRSGVPKLLVERARQEKRVGQTISAATQETLQAVLDLIATADDAVDAAQPLLAELIGVPNPDDDDSSSEDTETTEPAAPIETDSAPARQGMSLSLARARALA